MDINKVLIKFIRENNGLYNPVQKNYKNVRYKNRKWQEIASKLNINVEALRKRWRCIRDRYKRLSREQNINGAEYKLNNYKYAPLLTFLDDTLTNQEDTTNSEYHLTISNATTCTDDNLTDISDESRQFDSKDDDDIIEWSPVMSTEEQTTASNEQNQLHKNDGMLKFVEEILIPEANADIFNISSSNIKEEGEVEEEENDDDEPEKKKKYYAKSKEISFCENLAIQLNVANLPIAIFSKFQLAVYAAFQEAVYENESKTATSKFQAENKKRR